MAKPKIIPGTCGICAAQVADMFRHKRWHDLIDERIGDGQDSLELSKTYGHGTDAIKPRRETPRQ